MQKIESNEFLLELDNIRKLTTPWRTKARTETMRYWCYQLFGHALAHGIIERPEACQRCGDRPDHTLHGHHASYYHPIDVEWLCSKCHKAEHRKK